MSAVPDARVEDDDGPAGDAPETPDEESDAPDERPEGTVESTALTPRQRRVAAVGALGVAVGVLATVLGGVGAAPEGLLGVAGVVVATVGAWYGWDRLGSAGDDRALPRVETRSAVRRAGEDFEAAVEATRSDHEATAIGAWDGIVERLGPIAVDVVRGRDGVDPDAAREAVRQGTWMAPERGGSLLARTLSRLDPGELSLRPGYLRRSPLFERRVARAVRSLASYVLEDEPEPVWRGRDAGPGTEGRWVPGVWPTGRWHGVTGLGLVALGIAALLQSPGPALVGAVLLGLAGYARLFEPPEPRLAVDRTVETATPRPGEAVGVSVTVENEGTATLADLRVADGVPDRLAVVGGSPRHGTALRPGERATFEYDVRAVYGDHRFERLYAVARDPAGQRERLETVETEPLTLSCEPRRVHESVPLHPQTSGVTGRVASEVGGSGSEFHSVRTYRSGDPLRRVDWNRLARTGDLATLRFREEHAATVVVLVDAREAAFRAPTDDALSAVDRSLAGASQLVATLLADGDRVGLGTIGPAATWVRPGAGSDHHDRLAAAVKQDVRVSQVTEARFNRGGFVRRLRRRLPADAQLLCFSPLLDGGIGAIVRRLDAHGHQVTIFSPDPTATETVGGTVSRMERARRLARLRAAGLRVADWPHDEPLAVAVERAQQRWRG